jgi:hypothetical protein
MKITISRTTRPDPGKTLGFISEVFQADIEMDPENVQLLLELGPSGRAGAGTGYLTQQNSEAGEDRVFSIKDPLMLHTVLTSLARPMNHRQKNTQRCELIGLMRDHLGDAWELSWTTLVDMTLEIYTEFQEVQF